MNHRYLALLPFLVAACEGEPPKTAAVIASSTPPDVTPAAAAEEPEAPTAAAPAVAAPGALPPCGCNCACTGAAGVAPVAGAVAAPAGSAAPGGAAPVVAAAAAPAAARSITGTVTTLPKTSAGHAVIYLEDAPIVPGAKMSATVSNKMMNYLPYVSVVPVGGKVNFRNDDPFPHNVFSPDGERFTLGNIAQNEVRSRAFKTAGTYSLLCNLHPGMLGYVVVTPSSYYAKANVQGQFAIKDVPPGTYKVTAWAPRQQPLTQSVTVKDGDVAINFDLHR